MKVLGFDPGGSTGYSMILIENRIISPGQFGTTKSKTLTDLTPLFLEADHIVYEGFRLRPNKARSGAMDWSENVTEQRIGSIKTLCEIYQKPVTEQQPAVKPVGYGYANMKYVPGKKGTHWQDAFAHAVYFAVEKLRARPVG